MPEEGRFQNYKAWCNTSLLLVGGSESWQGERPMTPQGNE